MSDAEQKALGHDLVKAFRKSLARGFCQTHPLQSKLADEINPHYMDIISDTDRSEPRSSIIEGCDLRNMVADGGSASAIATRYK